MDRSGLTRGTRWYQACSPSLSSLEVIHEKTLPQKTVFLALVTSRTYSIRPIANLRAQIDSWDPGLSLGYLTILLATPFAAQIRRVFTHFGTSESIVVNLQS